MPDWREAGEGRSQNNRAKNFTTTSATASRHHGALIHRRVASARTALADAVRYALDIGVIDPDSIRVIPQHRSQKPVELFSLAGRPQLKIFQVETTDASAYGAFLGAR